LRAAQRNDENEDARSVLHWNLTVHMTLASNSRDGRYADVAAGPADGASRDRLSGVSERTRFMKKALFAATALSFAATVAYAQTEAAPPPPPQHPAADGPAATPPPPPPPGGPGGMHGPGRHGPGGWHKRHGMPSKAAHFRIRAGDVMINVKCADDDTTQACGQTVMQIIDKLQAEQSSGYEGDGDSGNDGNGDSPMNE
jgi:hypothetical protein